MKLARSSRQKRIDEKALFTLPRELQEKLNSDGARKLRFIDGLIRCGEEPYEYEVDVKLARDLLEKLFFGYLMRKGIDDGAEVLAQYLGHFLEHVYLVDSTKRRRTLDKVSKPIIKDFIELTYFSIPQELWDSGINPFDGMLQIHHFLNDLGYPVDVGRIERAVTQLRRELVNKPCSPPQAGQELTQ